MFTIYLKGVKVFAYHGVNPEENRDGQYFYLDVTAKTVTQAKELEDHLENTVSYAAINKLLAEGSYGKYVPAHREPGESFSG